MNMNRIASQKRRWLRLRTVQNQGKQQHTRGLAFKSVSARLAEQAAREGEQADDNHSSSQDDEKHHHGCRSNHGAEGLPETDLRDQDNQEDEEQDRHRRTLRKRLITTI